jgi:uncharacterized protein (DUF1330 family)/catechol 2,3-dioxygenase-like lactoylglutathione lyase family enzyme
MEEAMFDHVSLEVRDFSKSLAFYRAVLGPLGYRAESVDEAGKSAGFGRDGEVALWIAEGKTPSRAHLAFRAASRAAVEKFHEEALRLGGRDNGKPGLRPSYAADWFAAFALDPDGNNVEAVVHEASKHVYYIGTYDIVDPKAFAAYPPVVASLLPKYGGRVVAMDTSAHLVEGSARTMNAVILFPSKEAALGLYDDPDYHEAKRIRQRSTSNVSMVLARATA